MTSSHPDSPHTPTHTPSHNPHTPTRIPSHNPPSAAPAASLNSAHAVGTAQPCLDIVVEGVSTGGWGPVGMMAQLAASTLPARLIRLDHMSPIAAADKLRLFLPPRRSGTRHLLVIAPNPEALNLILRDHSVRRRYASINGWVIDSFWSDRIPRIARTRGWYDHLYVMDDGDVADWMHNAAGTIGVLPWGADTLSVADVATSFPRPVDLLRVGRQPESWDHDAEITALAHKFGVAYAGRPGFGRTEEESMTLLHRALGSARAVLAFTNLLSPASYTHPTKDYLTGRWTDALAHGCVVVGAVPSASAARQLVPEWASIRIPHDDPAAGVQLVAEASHSWTPHLAKRIHRHARHQLDWRHRFAVIARDLDIQAPKLERELALLTE
ncbi:glycosyltransferase family 1 protein [Devriesea agamarum]|uniref:glycosyltransferase family 1 protein n=1 Tax=Devriesea agamarum TaxID=472569 RepID=UPI0012EE7A47|nr:glycosyltransferase family 1 protein [Devriesea agamarum]